MPQLQITLNIDQTPWTDLPHMNIINPRGGIQEVTRMGILPNSTSAGRATVQFLVQLDDGRVVLAQTTWRFFEAAYKALKESPVVRAESN